MREIIVVLAVIMLSTPALAGSNKKPIVRPYLETPLLSLIIGPSPDYDNPQEPRNMEYRPNQASSLGVGITYGWISFSLSGSVELDRDTSKGSSYSENYTVSYQWKWLRVEANHSHYKGFYLTAPSLAKFFTKSGDIWAKYPELRANMQHLSVEFILWPDEFSLPALIDQSEFQSGSGGSPVFMALLDRYMVENDETMILEDQQPLYEPEDMLKGVDKTETSLLAGYGYTLERSGFYLGGAFLFGPSRQRTELIEVTDVPYYDMNTATKLYFGTGYNTEKNFAGFMFHLHRTVASGAMAELQAIKGVSQIFVGYRF